MKRLQLGFGFLLLLAACCDAYAEQGHWPETQIVFQLDNDLFSGSDRDYTNGVRFGAITEVLPESAAGKRFQQRLEAGAEKLGLGALQKHRFKNLKDLRFAKSLGITQLMFTPDNPDLLAAPEGERPYAGWLGLEYSLHAKSSHYVNSLTWTLGTTGEASLAQESQNWVHRNISNSPLYQGWRSQIPEELTLNVHFDHKQRYRGISRLNNGGVEFDGYYEGGFALGNFLTSAYVGTLARVGYRLPESFLIPRVDFGSFGHKLFQKPGASSKGFSFMAFVGLRASATLHDITLDGPIFRNFDTGVKSKPLEGELIYGLGARYSNVDVVFSQTVRSDEFEGQSSNQQFGSLMVRLNCWHFWSCREG